MKIYTYISLGQLLAITFTGTLAQSLILARALVLPAPDSDCHKNGACNRHNIESRLMKRKAASVGHDQMPCSTVDIHVSGFRRAFRIVLDSTRGDRASHAP